MRKSVSLRRLLLFTVAAIGFAYMAACVVLYTQQGALQYFPHPLTEVPDAQSVLIPADGRMLHGWVVNPGKSAAAIYFGGNGERVEQDVEFFRSNLPDRSVYLIPYRGYGPNSGEPSEAGIDTDSLAVFDFVQARHARAALIGRSLGTGVATSVAAHRPIERLVLVTPFDSVLNIARARYWIFPVSLLLRDRFESWRSAESIKAPVLIVLAADDRVVPRASSDALIAHFHVRPQLVVIAHAGHNNLPDSPVYATSIAQFMREPVATIPAIPSPLQ